MSFAGFCPSLSYFLFATAEEPSGTRHLKKVHICGSGPALLAYLPSRFWEASIPTSCLACITLVRGCSLRQAHQPLQLGPWNWQGQDNDAPTHFMLQAGCLYSSLWTHIPVFIRGKRKKLSKGASIPRVTPDTSPIGRGPCDNIRRTLSGSSPCSRLRTSLQETVHPQGAMKALAEAPGEPFSSPWLEHKQSLGTARSLVPVS